MNDDEEVFLMLRVPDAVHFVYRLPDGTEHIVCFNSENGTKGISFPCVGLQEKEADRLVKIGVGLRRMSREEYATNVKQVEETKKSTPTGRMQ